jgi:hypothetical protein
MSRLPDRPSPEYRSPKLFLLLFRLEVLILVSILAAAGFAAAGVLNDTVPAWLFAVSAAAGEGLLLGGCARLFFRRSSVKLQWAAGLAAAAVGLVVLGWLTGGLAGADPEGVMRSGPDWIALVQILIAAISATWAAAWGRVRYPPPPIVPAEVLEAGEAPPAKKSRTGAPKEPRPLAKRIRGILKIFRRNHANGEIRLVGSEEHKCPYCLQPVSEKDPRGVVTCPICKTRHHKDCWDVTGMCQVPHYHT